MGSNQTVVVSGPPPPLRPSKHDPPGLPAGDRVALDGELGAVGFGPGLEIVPVEDQPLVSGAAVRGGQLGRPDRDRPAGGRPSGIPSAHPGRRCRRVRRRSGSPCGGPRAGPPRSPRSGCRRAVVRTPVRRRDRRPGGLRPPATARPRRRASTARGSRGRDEHQGGGGQLAAAGRADGRERGRRPGRARWPGTTPGGRRGAGSRGSPSVRRPAPSSRVVRITIRATWHDDPPGFAAPDPGPSRRVPGAGADGPRSNASGPGRARRPGPFRSARN